MDHSINKNKKKKWATVIALDVILLILLCLFVVLVDPFSHPDIKIKGVFLKHPLDISDFHLIDQHGHPFTKTQLQGHWSLLFFGFTHCPMICPTTLDALNKTYALLKKQLPTSLLPRVVFVSIDPEQDTIARLKQYVGSYNTAFVAARTESNNISVLEKAFSISATKQKGVIDHQTDILVLNPKAQIQAYFIYPHSPEIMANDYQTIVKKLGSL